MSDVNIVLSFALVSFFNIVFKVSSHQLSCFEENLGGHSDCKVTKGVGG